MRKIVLLTCLSLLGALGYPPAGTARQPRDIYVIAHRHVSVSSLSHDELRPIFESRKTSWPDGSSLRAFNLPPSTRARQVMDEVVLSLTPDLMPRYWIDRRIRGEAGRPPTTVPSEALMLQVIKSLPGAIGYAEAPATDGSVKIVARISADRVLKP